MATRSERDRAKALPRPGDPLVLADGKEIYPEPLPGEELLEVEHASGINPRTFRPGKKRTLKELPTTPAMLNGIACVFMYTVMGIGEREIANALKISSAELASIKKHPAYKDCFEGVLDEFISVNSNLIQARIAAYGRDAVTNIMDIASHGKKEENKLRANIDIADRAGIGGKNAQKSVLNDLHITISKGDSDEVKVDIGSVNSGGINGHRS